MRSRLFTFASTVSALLFVTTCVLWVRSYRVTDQLNWLSPRTDRTAIVSEGRVAVLSERLINESSMFLPPAGRRYGLTRSNHRKPDSSDRWLFGFTVTKVNGREADFQLGGFRFAFQDGRGNFNVDLTAHLLISPLWLLDLLFLLLPVSWIAVRFKRRAGESRHLCTHCGYDLRATPDRCTECGAVPAGKAGT